MKSACVGVLSITILYVSVMLQHTVCMCICCIPCREHCMLPEDDLRIETYNKVLTFVTYNFSKEHCMLPEDDLRIETCRSVLNALV